MVLDVVVEELVVDGLVAHDFDLDQRFKTDSGARSLELLAN